MTHNHNTIVKNEKVKKFCYRYLQRLGPYNHRPRLRQLRKVQAKFRKIYRLAGVKYYPGGDVYGLIYERREPNNGKI